MCHLHSEETRKVKYDSRDSSVCRLLRWLWLWQDWCLTGWMLVSFCGDCKLAWIAHFVEGRQLLRGWGEVGEANDLNANGNRCEKKPEEERVSKAERNRRDKQKENTWFTCYTPTQQAWQDLQVRLSKRVCECAALAAVDIHLIRRCTTCRISILIKHQASHTKTLPQVVRRAAF